jgi:hypothetical protein
MMARWLVCWSYALARVGDFSNDSKNLRIDSGPRGRGFESTRPDHLNTVYSGHMGDSSFRRHR